MVPAMLTICLYWRISDVVHGIKCHIIHADHTTWPNESAWRQAPWYRSQPGYVLYVYCY